MVGPGLLYLVILLLLVIVIILTVRILSLNRKLKHGALQSRPLLKNKIVENINEIESGFMNCPMCGEEIKSVAIKCKHCGSLLTAKSSVAQGGMVDGPLGLVSLISGIVAFFIGILLVHLGVLLGLTAVVCGVLGFGKGQKYSLPGIVAGIAAVLFSLIYSFVSMSRF